MAGTEAGRTTRENVNTFDRIGFVTRVGGSHAHPPSLATTALGMPIDIPVLLAPVGAHAVHPAGEVGTARAAAQAGTAIVHSSFASQHIREVVAANPRAVAQLYWVGPRDVMADHVDRVAASGATALTLTMDIVPGPMHRDQGSPRMPEALTVLEMLRAVPDVIGHPRWLARFLASGLPTLTLPNLQTPASPAPSLVAARRLMTRAGPPTWQDVAWLRSRWNGPFMVKGVMHPVDARRAVDTGATAVSVSNHGGNNLDGTVSALRSLPAIVDAVGNDVEVLYDGGIRRGGDVATALALGARAVLVGRAWVFALAARGEGGVREILTVLRDGLSTTVLALGHSDITQLSPDDLVLPRDFTPRAEGGWSTRR